MKKKVLCAVSVGGSMDSASAIGTRDLLLAPEDPGGEPSPSGSLWESAAAQ